VVSIAVVFAVGVVILCCFLPAAHFCLHFLFPFPSGQLKLRKCLACAWIIYTHTHTHNLSTHTHTHTPYLHLCVYLVACALFILGNGCGIYLYSGAKSKVPTLCACNVPAK